MNVNEKSQNVYAIGTAVLVSNALLIYLYFYYLPTYRLSPAVAAGIRTLVDWLAMAAVFPLDCFDHYMDGMWGIALFWFIAITACSVGLFRFSRYARTTFIFLNIIYIATLVGLLVFDYSRGGYLSYFFKLYFSLVFFGIYVGFLTIPEIRMQFDKGWWKGQGMPFRLTERKIPRSDANGYFNLGLAYKRLERYEDAADALRKAAVIDSQNADVFYQLGLTMFCQRKLNESIEHFRQAIQLDPEHVQALFYLGLTYQQEGCDEQAIPLLEKAAKMSPNDPETLKHLAEAYASGRRYAEAVLAFQKLGQLNPQDYDAFYRLGKLALDSLDRPADALEAFRRAARLQPDRADIQHYLGLTYIKLKKHKDAIRAFKEVLRIDAGHKQAHYQLGFTYALIQDFDSARREQTYLEKKEPDLARTLAMLIK